MRARPRVANVRRVEDGAQRFELALVVPLRPLPGPLDGELAGRELVLEVVRAFVTGFGPMFSGSSLMRAASAAVSRELQCELQ